MTVPLTLLFWRALIALAAFGLVSSFVFLSRNCRRRPIQETVRVTTERCAFLSRRPTPARDDLKPVHGMEERLEENLESFFQQDYPDYEMIIGARSEDDPAILLAKKIAQSLSADKDPTLSSGPPEWPNAKVFTLDKMIPLSRNDFFVISDSDVRVDHDFLRNVIPPLFDRKLAWSPAFIAAIQLPISGLFWKLWGCRWRCPQASSLPTCWKEFVLAPRSGGRASSRLASMLSAEFAPPSDYYSDDYVLGNKIWAAGYKVIFSHYFIHHVLTPRSFARTLGDQLRWMKSTRHSRPWGHIGSGLTFAMPFGLLGLIAGAALGHWGLGLSFSPPPLQIA